ncbi:YdeI/OmpD-associated family protein [Nocardia sp. CC213A]
MRDAFDACGYSKRRGWVRDVVAAKRPETRVGRIQKIIDALRG